MLRIIKIVENRENPVDLETLHLEKAVESEVPMEEGRNKR